MSVFAIFAITATVLDIVCIIAVIFFERKNPASTIAWTLVLIFLPFVGFIVYAMFGSGFHVNKKKRYALKQITDSLNKEVIAKYIDGKKCALKKEAVSYERLVSYLDNDGDCLYTCDNAVRVYTNGVELFQSMLEDMRTATRSIHLLYYIFRNDALGREVLGLLTKKAEAGVSVRLIYDSVGSMLSSERMFRKLRAAGGKVEAFSPLFFTLSSHLRLNYRNHRKITVIDGKIAYMGGMNIGEEYLGRHRRMRPWRDTQIRLTGSSVSFLQERFLMDWISVEDAPVRPQEFEGYFPQPLEEGNLGLQIVSSGPDTTTNSIKNGLLELVYSARKNVFIQTPYFTPDDSFIDALLIAARAGVDVRLMLPAIADSHIVAAATYSYAWQLLETGVSVYRYDGFLHAKTMVVDGMAATIGSANIGTRSFALNFEINAFLYDTDFAAQCERIFLHDQRNCTKLTEEWFLSRNPAVRIAFSLCRLFAPLI